ncbi:MAG: tRNA pseudouridine(55) synthase TruB [Paludibacteraceae bacterium]|nr:tRNA pseudouridine(55) synthase TruB [Paludibacteraceae bacterium]
MSVEQFPYSLEQLKEGRIFYVDKPLEWTSFDVVNRLRSAWCKYFKEKKLKVGHAGTLDPLATGVIVVCTGKCTKQIDQLQAGEKEYIATLELGATTPSFDMEHPIDQRYPFEHITLPMVEEVLTRFTGEILQVPPAYSAVKIDGKRAYDYARKGREVEIKAKPLLIKEIEILDFELPRLQLRIVCSKGTYIRALARDIGAALNSGAYLTALQRTRVGDVRLEQCSELNALLTPYLPKE